MLRGVDIPAAARQAANKVPAVCGEVFFGYVKDDYRRPTGDSAILVTAKWACLPGDASHLKYWWQRVGTDAFSGSR